MQLDNFQSQFKAVSRISWHRSLLGKIGYFLLTAVVLAFVSGALTGWIMMENGQRQDWRRQAEMNAQIATAAIRNIYSFVTVDAAPSGQIVRIRTDRLIGDDQSVLDTGFNPADVLALASLQTKQPVWLFRSIPNEHRLVSITDSDAGEGGQLLRIANAEHEQIDASNTFFTGFVEIAGAEYFTSYLPIQNNQGDLLGAVVASVGSADTLLQNRAVFYRNTLIILGLIMVVTGGAIVFVMKGLFHPVPTLIQSLKRIAEDDTGNLTPFQERGDEIGQLATAIETLRAAVVEREHLRQVRETAREMEHLAHHDPLTGLPNRTSMIKCAEAALEEMREAGKAFNLLLLDLDRFKPVNDTYGHAVGDRILVMTAERVSALLAPGDVFARLGGDEFALLQRLELSGDVEGRKLASRIIEAIEQPFSVDGRIIEIGGSIGIATAPVHAASRTALIHAADIALYASKAAGRGQFTFFEPGMDMPGGDTMKAELLRALAHKEFELHYQPIVNLSDVSVLGYEALLRWRHPEQGLILPDTFIPTAEDSGLIVEIGQWILEQACQDACGWEDGQKVAVNISAVQLHRGDIGASVRQALASTGLPPSRLELELTESVLLNRQEAEATLADIRNLGVGLALDDFGTGFSTFTYLAELPVTRIKLDRHFVSTLETNERSRAILASTINLARNLQLEVTAEGIENMTQLAWLRGVGCDAGQGYLFGKPQRQDLFFPSPSRLVSARAQ
ncbi:putative bifunctional diguanylate cyclase/phosphodiesterase [Rhizobium oryzicola]|uniref:EAL domain-containing protein n=1 Tax=Rhizobium oryzicola TaxID=1232668 RepID=A0ABT8SZK7_9HYPH|nr:EAL domain-containing protein [Rhizobium oryzicola]MDO1583328.1 EAL domain-containing protein [Rhizobium oryzicola]